MERIINWTMRPDLIVRSDGPGRWIVKDPVSLRYAMLNDTEYAVLQSLDGRATLTALMQNVTSLNRASGRGELDARARELRASDVSDLLTQFRSGDLIVPTVAIPPGPHPAAREATARASWRFRARRITRMVQSLLAVRLPLGDPSPLLRRMTRMCRGLFSRPVAMLWCLIVTLGAIIVAARFAEFANDLPSPSSMLTTDRLVATLAMFVIVKALHELGHACAATSAGVECREAGVMLMLFTPIPYTNVSDVWMLERRQRVLVTAAGVLVELAVAGLCVLLWSLMVPGFARSLLASVAVFCSVTTVLFNANPLVRFDGYFLLSDLWNKPNLGQQSSSATLRWFERLLLGPSAKTHARHDRGESALVTFGLLSVMYRALLILTIAMVVLAMFQQRGLSGTGVVVALILLGPMCGPPLVALVSAIITGFVERRHRGAMLARCAVIVGCLILGVMIPLPRSIVVPGVVEPAGAAVFCASAGRLVNFEEYGTVVDEGRRVGELLDPELQADIVRADADIRQKQLRLRTLELRRDPLSQSQLPECREALRTSERVRNELASRMERTQCVSPGDGILLPPRGRISEPLATRLSTWDGVPLDQRNLGATLDLATVLGVVAPCDRFEVQCCFPDGSDAPVSPGQHGQFQLTSLPGTRFSGSLANLGRNRNLEIPDELVVTRLASASNPTASHGAVRVARFEVQLTDGQPMPLMYSTGQVKLALPRESLFEKARRWLRELFGSQ